MKFETIKFADVSTGHITKGDRDLLEQKDREWATNFIVVASYEEGFFIAIGSEFSENDAKDVVSSGYSQAFANLLLEMAKQEIHYLRLDRDGYDVDGAPEFDW